MNFRRVISLLFLDFFFTITSFANAFNTGLNLQLRFYLFAIALR